MKPDCNPSFAVASELAHFDKPIPELLKSLNTDATHLGVGVVVFDHAGRVLLVQRSANDSMASKWEIPGGGCDPDDLSVLHSAYRELQEETGLRAGRILRVVGDGYRFQSSKGLKILKLTFEVDLDDAGAGSPNENMTIAVKLDPKEHQNWLWASEEEVGKERAGDITLKFTKKEQKDVIQEAFARRRAQKQGYRDRPCGQ